jgi:hypothetical protein
MHKHIKEAVSNETASVMDLFKNLKRLSADLCTALRAELRHITVCRLPAALRASCRSCCRLRLTTVAAELTCITCLTA